MRRIAPILLITVGAAVLRLNGLDSKCLWIDEALSYALSDLSVSEIVERCAKPGSFHPPLYFCLLRLWTLLTADTEFALRLPAALFGIASVPCAYLLLRQLLQHNNDGKPKFSTEQIEFAACLYALLIAVNPTEIFAAKQVRGYTLGVVLWFLGSIVLLKALSRPRERTRYFVLFILISAAQCYTHNVCLLMVLTQCVFLCAYAWRSQVGQNAPSIATVAAHESLAAQNAAGSRIPLRAALLVCVFILLFCTPWLAAFAQQTTNATRTFERSFNWATIPVETFVSIFATFSRLWKIDFWMASAFSVLILSVLLRGTVRGGPAGKFLALNTLLPIAIMLVFSVGSERTLIHSRYLIFPMAACLGAVAMTIAELRGRAERFLVVSTVGIWTIYALFINWSVIGPAAAPGMRAASQYIVKRMTESEPVLTAGPVEQIKLAYYLRHTARPKMVVADPADGFWGRRYVRNKDLIPLEDLLGIDHGSLWLVNERHKISQAIPIQEHWEIISSKRFPQQHRWERSIQVLHVRISHPNETANSLRGFPRVSVPRVR